MKHTKYPKVYIYKRPFSVPEAVVGWQVLTHHLKNNTIIIF